MIEFDDVVICIQARMSSSRLPGKVMMDINGKPVIMHLIDRIRTFFILIFCVECYRST